MTFVAYCRDFCFAVPFPAVPFWFPSNRQLFGIVPGTGGNRIVYVLPFLGGKGKDINKFLEIFRKCLGNPRIIPGNSHEMLLMRVLVYWFSSSPSRDHFASPFSRMIECHKMPNSCRVNASHAPHSWWDIHIWETSGAAKGSSSSWVAELKGDKNSECKLSKGWSRSYRKMSMLRTAGVAKPCCC